MKTYKETKAYNEEASTLALKSRELGTNIEDLSEFAKHSLTNNLESVRNTLERYSQLRYSEIHLKLDALENSLNYIDTRLFDIMNTIHHILKDVDSLQQKIKCCETGNMSPLNTTPISAPTLYNSLLEGRLVWQVRDLLILGKYYNAQNHQPNDFSMLSRQLFYTNLNIIRKYIYIGTVQQRLAKISKAYQEYLSFCRKCIKLMHNFPANSIRFKRKLDDMMTATGRLSLG